MSGSQTFDEIWISRIDRKTVYVGQDGNEIFGLKCVKTLRWSKEQEVILKLKGYREVDNGILGEGTSQKSIVRWAPNEWDDGCRNEGLFL